MTLNEPGLLARRQMTMTHPIAAGWPSWLRSWWGQIDPPPLMLRIPAFPTLTRLPSPSLFPSLSLDVLGRFSTFLASSLPFLDAGGSNGHAPALPRFDYRLRRPRVQPVRVPQADLGAHANTELSSLPAEGPEPAHVAETHPALEHETLAPAEMLTAHEAEPPSHEPAPEASLTPFHETEWDLPAAAPSPTLDESVQHAESWREAWSAVNVPEHVTQTLGVLRNTLGSTVRSGLLNGTGLAVPVGEASAAQPDLMAGVEHLLPLPPELSAPLLPGLANVSESRDYASLHLPGAPSQRIHRPPALPAGMHEPRAGEALTLPESLAAEHAPLQDEIAEPAAFSEAPALLPSALLGAVLQLAPLATSPRISILGEVLRHHERAVDTLSLIEQRPAGSVASHLGEAVAVGEPPVSPARHFPGLPAAVEPFGALAQGRPQELVSTFLPQFEPLQRIASLPNMALRAANLTNVAGPLAGAQYAGMPAGEAFALPGQTVAEDSGQAHEEGLLRENQHFARTEHGAQLIDHAQPAGITHAAEPVLELLHPLDTFASAFRRPSLPRLRDMLPAAAMPGIAALASLPGFGHTELPAGIMQQAPDVHLRRLPAEHFNAAVEPESPGAAAMSTAEHVGSPLGRLNLMGLPGLSVLEHQLARADHPLALRSLPEIGNLLLPGAAHAAQLPAPELRQAVAQEFLPPPSMELRHDVHVPPTPGQAQANVNPSAAGQWLDPTGGQAVEQHALAIPQFGGSPVAESPAGSADSGVPAWQGSGGTTAGGAAGGSGASETEAIARQVFALLQSQLRAERDRHQIYDR